MPLCSWEQAFRALDDSEIKYENWVLSYHRAWEGTLVNPEFRRLFLVIYFAEEVRGCWLWGLAWCGDLEGRAGADLEVGPVSRWGKGDPRGSIPPLVERLHSARTTELLVFRLEIKRHLVQIVCRNYSRTNRRAQGNYARERIYVPISLCKLWIFSEFLWDLNVLRICRCSHWLWSILINHFNSLYSFISSRSLPAAVHQNNQVWFSDG